MDMNKLNRNTYVNMNKLNMNKLNMKKIEYE